jgi:anaerobic carbon-monoxide dehydrogenase iron sulfur subunit
LKRITVDSSVCTGCRACEMACSFAHTDTFSSDLARIRIAKKEEVGMDVPIVCQMCWRPACVDACPVGALERDDRLGHIILDESRCTGCGLCTQACPHLAVSSHPETGMPLICDLCGGEPACVERCVVRAIRFEQPDRALARRRVQLAATRTAAERGGSL